MPGRPDAGGAWCALAALAVAAGLAAASLATLRPPAAATGERPADQFSAERAREHVAALARAPHPVGSAEHARVREELVARVEAAGVPAVVQHATAARPAGGGGFTAARVANVLARVEGSAGRDDQALLLAAHYDSVPEGPGAADDGAAVGALLEVLRLVAARLPRHDVVFLFSDAEERGALGAAAFAAEHPWARDVARVLNFEARGTRGPAIMFQTGPGSRGLVAAYGAAAPRPVAFSFSEDVFRLLPHVTDFQVFRRGGVAGLDFAFIHGRAAYHTRADDLARLDLRSLTHHGATALALVERLAGAEADAAGGGEAVFFTLPAVGLVVYPRSWAAPLALLAAVAAVALLVLAARRRRPRPRGVIGGFLAVPAAVLGAVVGTAVLEGLLSTALGAGPRTLGDGVGWGGGWLLVALGLALLLLWPFARRLGIAGIAAAGIAWWAVATAAVGLLLPASAYLWTWPLLAALPAFAALAVARIEGLRLCLLLALPAFVLVLLWTPLVALLPVALGVRAAAALALLAAFAAALLAPQALLLAARAPRAGALAAVVLGLAAAALAAVTGADDVSHTRPASVEYLFDAEEDAAWWITLDPPPDPWTAQYLPAASEHRSFAAFYGDRELLSHPAPRLAVAPPRVVAAVPAPAEAAPATGATTIAFRVLPGSGDGEIVLVLRSQAAIAGLRLDGRPVDVERLAPPAGAEGDGPPPRARLELAGAPADGFHVEAVLAEAAPLLVEATGWGRGLPSGAPAAEPPPPDLEPRLRTGARAARVLLTTGGPGASEPASPDSRPGAGADRRPPRRTEATSP